MITVSDVRKVMDRAYPPYLAESWDAVGLICGDPAAPVSKVMLALDCTQEVADKAVDIGADMLIVHHPLLLRGVSSVAADTPKGKVIHTLITGGVALFAAHTNADSARPGVNDKLAEVVGTTPGRPVKPILKGLDKWGIYVPESAAQSVKDAVFEAGAGAIGDYSQCSFEWKGTGQFLPHHNAQPVVGHPRQLERTEELRVEFVAPARLRTTLIDAIRAAHPYEEPAFDVVSMQSTQDLETAEGLGRVGTLPEPMRFGDFVQQVADALPETSWGIRAAGDPEQMVHTVAVSSGSGDSFLDAVAALGVDVYVTSDLRHHPADESRRAQGPLLIDTAHWASEFPWTYQVQELLAQEFAQLDVEVATLRTDPWNISAHPQLR